MKFKSILACSLALAICAVTVNAAPPSQGTPAIQTEQTYTQAQLIGTATNAPGDTHYCSVCGVNPVVVTETFATNFNGIAPQAEVGDDYGSAIGTAGNYIKVSGDDGLCTDLSACSVTAQDCVDLSPCVSAGASLNWMRGATPLASPVVYCIDIYDVCGGIVDSLCFGTGDTSGPNLGPCCNGTDGVFAPTNGFLMVSDLSGNFGGDAIIYGGTILNDGLIGNNDLNSMVITPNVGPFDPSANTGDQTTPVANDDLMPFAIFGNEIAADSEPLIAAGFGFAIIVPGACCFPAAVCSIMTACDCSIAGGTYGGDGSACAGVDPDGDGIDSGCDVCELDPDNDIDGDGFCCVGVGDVGTCTDTSSCSVANQDCVDTTACVADTIDLCCDDPTKTAPGICGCDIPDTDTDGDGVADCNDACPVDPAKVLPGQCGCGIADTDDDGDGVANCNDFCPGLDDAIFHDALAPAGFDCTGEIPTVSEWGLVILALLLLVAGKVYFGRRTVLS